MGNIILVGAGIFIGWLLFRPKEQHPVEQKSASPSGERGQEEMRQMAGHDSHSLRDVAGGMAAGAVLGHMLSGDKKVEAQETNRFYNAYNDYYDHDELVGEDYDEDEDYTSDYDYDIDDYDNDDYSSYDDYDGDYDSGYDSDYDSSSDWDSDSYDDGGDW